MPPVPSPGLRNRHDATRSSAEERAQRVRFRRAMTLMAMTIVLPGSAQLVAGNRRVGRIALRVWLVLVGLTLATVLVGLVWHGLVFKIAVNTALLGVLRLGLMVGAVAWAALLVDAWRIGQPLSLALNHRRAVVGVNGVLCFTVAGVLLFGAHIVGVQRNLMLSMFTDGQASGAHDGRYNVLLVGGDSGAGRWGLRTDSMTVASIDAETGRTVLIGLPRNMTNFPFAPGSKMAKFWPHGFNCGYPDCELNAVNTWVGDHLEKFKGDADPGMDATISAIEGITGLPINYWAMVNLEGFKDLVDAVGGVTLNVRSPIPVGGLGDDVTGYIQPGIRKLDGHDALWFARSREGSDDYSRMARQKCVMNAMLQQISPQSALQHFQAIAEASSAMISTSIPAGEVDRFIDLALKARGQQVSTLSLVPPLVNTAEPDIDLIQKKVAQAIGKAEGQAPAGGSGGSGGSGGKKHSASNGAVTGGSLGSLGTGYAANHASDLGSAC